MKPAHSSLKIVLFLALALMFTAVVPACNTVDGAGKDVENLGEGIQKAAD